jgi:hypothetical protein
VVLALVRGEGLEDRVAAGAALPWGTVFLPTFKNEWCRVEGDSQAKQSPTAQSGIRTLLEIGQEPGVDSGPASKFLGTESKFLAAMRDPARQISGVTDTRMLRSGVYC